MWWWCARPVADETNCACKPNICKSFPTAISPAPTKPVVITEGRSRLAGVGMEFNNKTRQFKLLSRVRGAFDAGK